LCEVEECVNIGRSRRARPLYHIIKVKIQAPSLEVWPQHRWSAAFALDGDGKGKWTQVGVFEIGLVADFKNRMHDVPFD
jgi:hypothetical protein